MNEEKNKRWSAILESCPLEESYVTVRQEVEYIQRNNTPLLEILRQLPEEYGFHHDNFLSLYNEVSQCIPDEWFVDSSSVDQFRINYNALPILANIHNKARRKIWIDVPRTYAAFSSSDETYSNIISDSKRNAHLCAVLCRTLSVASIYVGGDYCQGMSFLAASYILYCKVHLFSNFVHDEEMEAYAAAAFLFITLLKNNIADLYIKEVALSEYINGFKYQLAAWHTESVRNGDINGKLSVLYKHLESHGLDVQYFVVKWFGSCFSLDLSTTMLSCLQEIFIYGNMMSGQDSFLMMRLGISILYNLADDLMKLTDFESLYFFLKENTAKLTPSDIIPVMFLYHMKQPSEEPNVAANEKSRVDIDCGCILS